MTQDEFKDKLAIVNKEHDQAKVRLLQKYATSNNTHKIGDIIEDHHTRIQITEIKWGSRFADIFSECIYYGIIINKSGKVNKRMKTNCIWQSNIKEVI